MSEILRQIDDDLRRDRLVSLWNKYGIYTIILFFIIIGAVVGYQYNKSINISRNEVIVEKYLNATKMENLDNAINKFSSVNSSNNNYLSSLSDLKLSNLYIEMGKKDEGIARLEVIMNDEKNDPIIVDMAIYLYLLIKMEEFDENDFKNILTTNKINSSQFKYLYKELLAIKSLLEGNNANSIAIFDSLISDPKIPVDILQRANKFIKLVD